MTLQQAIDQAEARERAKGKPAPKANRGKVFETELIDGHDHYRATGLAAVEKVPTPYRQVPGDNGQSKLIRLRSTVDYKGTIKGGWSVDIEAKSTLQTTRWDFDDIHQHQVDHLNLIDSLGGVAFVLVKHIPGAAVYLIRGRDMADLWDRARWRQGRASLSLADLRRFPKVPTRPHVPVDWLPIVHELWPHTAPRG